MGEQPAEEVALEYVTQIRAFHEELCQSGWAENEVIKTAGILQSNPTIEQVMTMPAFVRKKVLACRAREKRERE